MHHDTSSDFSSATRTSSAPGRRALVLGGGGSTGNAWLLGVIAGLADAGLTVTDADLIIGTSAGATATAQLTGADPAELYEASLTPPPARRPQPSTGDAGGRGLAGSTINHLERTDRIISDASDADDMRRRMAAAALELPGSSDPEIHSRWRATVASRLPSQEWPDQQVLLTAVDANTGEPVVFTRESGVSLADAVAASCASGFDYRLGDRQYIDGGYRRNENADLAAGCARVLVLSPFGGRTRTPLEWGQHLGAQVDELRDAGSAVEVISPEPENEHLFGANAMNLALRPNAARVGFEQGQRLAGKLALFWDVSAAV
ncbi:patatin-like phospholipase family protein [Arthrobacter sp. Y-9]|uniref:patatin-like phospholipase family protein n=1 Tax=Arthrobacter sp. Y-9 TaxID=3039385 RepID=UPI00241CBD44|nr:patatin-like phospholipase family protein [Arthrobacter sp. Y-9]WFR84229.1 patatin-like phospholipase family protein [Arthrobacter sp. Y-9]